MISLPSPITLKYRLIKWRNELLGHSEYVNHPHNSENLEDDVQ